MPAHVFVPVVLPLVELGVLRGAIGIAMLVALPGVPRMAAVPVAVVVADRDIADFEGDGIGERHGRSGREDRRHEANLDEFVHFSALSCVLPDAN